MPKASQDWFCNFVRENEASRKKVSLAHEDVFQLLLSIKDKYRKSMPSCISANPFHIDLISEFTNVEMAGHSLMIFLEGYETSSTTMSFVLYELARAQHVQDRLYQEIVDVLKRHNNEFTYEALQDMVYLDQCVSGECHRFDSIETLAQQFLCRNASSESGFGGDESSVHETIHPPEAGGPKRGSDYSRWNGCSNSSAATSSVSVSQSPPVGLDQLTIHLFSDPNHYSDPEVFNPDHFSEEERKNRHKAHYIPFGEGPRMCPGMRFAIAQIKAATVSVVLEFKVKLSPNHKPFEVDILSMLYQAKDGLLLNFEPRK